MLLLGTGITVAGAVQMSCMTGCTLVAGWFDNNPTWGQDGQEFLDMCMKVGCRLDREQ